jgi:hypothetical protein
MDNTRLLNLPASGNHQLLENTSFWTTPAPGQNNLMENNVYGQ